MTGWGYALRLAWRNLGRNPRRTLLSVAGIGVGGAMALMLTSFHRGSGTLIARMAAESGIGHLRVVPQGWMAKRDNTLRLTDPAGVIEAVRQDPEVTAAAPRTRVQALLAMGVRVAAVEMAGVDPAAEPRVYRYVNQVTSGRYLRPGERGAVVIGRAIADRLRVDVDDDVVATAVGRGGRMDSEMFRVAGIVTVGSRDIESGICQVVLADVERLTGLPGWGEVAVLVRDQARVDAARERVAARLPPGNEAVTWGELLSDLKGHMAQDRATGRIMIGLVAFLVLLGVMSAQLTAILERRKEFAILEAIGMPSNRVVVQVWLEGVVLGLCGTAASLLLAGPFVYRWARWGLDVRSIMAGSSWTFEGVLIEPVIFTSFGWWMVGHAAALAVGSTLLASVYPSWFAARTDPAAALRAAQ